MTRAAVARVVGQALTDKSFAEQLSRDPQAAAHSIGIHLGDKEAAALKQIDHAKMEAVSAMLRQKLPIAAFFDQQQQQQQARMD
jgi:predicted secreted hydrolase